MSFIGVLFPIEGIAFSVRRLLRLLALMSGKLRRLGWLLALGLFLCQAAPAQAQADGRMYVQRWIYIGAGSFGNVDFWFEYGWLYTTGTYSLDYRTQVSVFNASEANRLQAVSGQYIVIQFDLNNDPDAPSFIATPVGQLKNNGVEYFSLTVGGSQTYTVTPHAGSGGTISPSSPQSVNRGGSVTFSASANSGYTVDRWYLDDIPVQIGGTTYTVSNVTENHQVRVTFKSTGTSSYVVTPSAGTGGNISPSSPQTVSAGGSVAFTATANSGYTIYQWFVNGSMVRTGGSSYTVNNVQSNMAVQVTFSSQTYGVTPSAGSNGTINPSSTQYVSHGGSVSFTATPNPGYGVSEWRLDGTLVQTGGTSYTVTNVTSSRSLSVSFRQEQIDITITGPPGSPTLYRLDVPPSQVVYVTGTYTGPVQYVEYRLSNSDDSLYTYGRPWQPAHIATASTWNFPLISPDDLPLGATVVYAKASSSSGAESAVKTHTIHYGMTPLESPNPGRNPGRPYYPGSGTPKPVVVANALEGQGSYRVKEARLLGGDFDPTKVLASQIVWLASTLEPEGAPVSFGGQPFYPLTGSTGAQVLSALAQAGEAVPAGRVYISALRLAAPSFKQTNGFTAYYDFDLRVEAEGSPSFTLSQQALQMAVHWENALHGMRCLPSNNARLIDAQEGSLPDLDSQMTIRIVTRPFRGTIDRDWAISGRAAGATAVADRMRRIFRDAEGLRETGTTVAGAIGEVQVGTLGWRASALPANLGGPGGREPFYIERPSTATDRAAEQREKDRQEIIKNTGGFTLRFWGAVTPDSPTTGDVTAPTVAITSPVSGSTITAGTLSLAGTASDNVAVGSVWVRANGGAWIKASGTTNWSASISLASLSSVSFPIDAQALDSSGNASPIASIGAYFFPTDTSRPSIAINSPAEGAHVSSQTVTFSGTASDNVGLASVRLRVNNGPWVTPSGTASWSVSLKLAPGSNTIEAQATDTSANTQSAFRRVVNDTADSTPPTVAIQAPASGAVVSSAYLTITGTASDNLSVASVAVRINGGNWTAATGTTSWSASALLSLGSNTIEARAQDWAGLDSSAVSQTVTFQPSPRTAYPGTIDLERPAGYFEDGPDLAAYGGASGDRFGSVIRAADLNGDFIDDLIVSAPGADPVGRTDAGAVYVWLGKGTLAGTKDVAGVAGTAPDITIRGATAGDALGTAMAVGDVNGDGITDLVIGATFADGLSDGRPDAGEAYIVYGRASFPAVINLASTSSSSGANVTIYGVTAGDYLTSEGALTVADVNDDGYADILLGANDADGPTSAPREDNGEAYIVFGRASSSFPTRLDLATQGTSGASVTFLGPQNFDRVTRGGLTTADVNGDGVLDILIGGRGGDGPNNSRPNTGEAYIVFGRRSPATFPLTIDLGVQGSSGANVTIYGATESDRLTYGNALCAGDFNGDGYDDIALGATWADGPSEGRPEAGEAYLVFGRASFPTTLDLAVRGTSGANVTIYGASSYDYLADGALAVGDVNGDGYADLVLGSKYADGPSEARYECGEAYIVFGRASFPQALDLASKGSSGASVTIYGASYDGYLTYDRGLVVKDITGDGIADLLLKAPYASDRQSGEYGVGELCIVFGRQSFHGFPTTLDLRNDGFSGANVVIPGISGGFDVFEWDYPGTSGGISAGDFDGDGVRDLVVGRSYGAGPNGDRSDGGEVYVLRGIPPGRPAITSVSSVAIHEDSATGPISFTVSDPQLPGEALSVTASSSSTTLVPTANISLGGTGADRTVTVQPAANRSGTATITLRVTNGSRSATTTFVLTVNSVNDAPSFVKGANQTVLEDSGAQSVANWATSISAGPNESQSLNFLVSDNNAALFAVRPAISSAGTLTYTPAANANGSATVTVALQDSGGTANGGVDTSPAQTFTITVTAVNDPPTIVQGVDPTVLEDAGAVTLAGWGAPVSKGAANESGQTLSATVTTNNDALFAVKPALNLATGDLTFTPAADQFGIATVTLTLTDNGGTANGGADRTVYQFWVTVVAVNDPPRFTRGPNQVVLEEAGAVRVSPWASVLAPGPANESAQTMYLRTTIDRPELFSSGPTLYTNGDLGFTPASNRSGTATITWTITDNGGTDYGGLYESAPQTFTITITGINDAPSFVKGPDVVVNEDAGSVTLAGWATNIDRGGPDEAEQVLTFTVTSLTNAGLFAVAPHVAPDGTLAFTPAADVSGSSTVTIRLSDDGGTANGGANTSATQSFTITVNPVNDPPTFVAGPNESVLEDSGAHSVLGWAWSVTAGAPDESTQGVSFLVSNDNEALFTAPPRISPSGSLYYTLAPDAFGVANVTVRAQDTGGTANGGRDTSDPVTFTITVGNVNDVPAFVKGGDRVLNEDAGPQTVGGWATGISAGPANEASQTLTFLVAHNSNPGLFAAGPAVSSNGTLTFTSAPNVSGSATITLVLSDDGGTAGGGVDVTAPQTFTITVQPVNDRPVFVAGPNVTVIEDAPPQSLEHWATGISPGAPDESGQALHFTIENDNPALFTAQPAIGLDGRLTFTPAPDAHGVARVSLTLHDDGDTANGGENASATQVFEVAVLSANDPPSFARGGDQQVREDSGPRTVNGWATAIFAGPPNEAEQTLTFLVSTDRPELFASGPAVSSGGVLTFTPAQDAFGTAEVTVTLRDSGGVANQGSDASGPQSFVIAISPVNDAPVFAGRDVTVDEDAGPQILAGWGTIAPGPANEDTQAVTVTTDNDAPQLFSVPPTVALDGTLTFTPAPDAHGTARLTVSLRDDGGTEDGGADTAPPLTFTVVVRSLNDAPTFVAGDNLTVTEEDGPQTVPAWATAMSPGPADESDQGLTFLTQSSRPELFSAGPSIAPNGTLTFTSAPNRSGTATVTVRLADTGGTANGGRDTSDPQQFEIVIEGINDPPSFVKGEDQNVREDAGLVSVPGWARSIDPGSPDEVDQTLTFSTSVDDPELFERLPAVAADGTLTYRTAPDLHGSATVTLFLADDGGTARGGGDRSPQQTFSINVSSVNDAPVFTKGDDLETSRDTGPQSVGGWVTAISPGPADEAGQEVSFVVTAQPETLFAQPPAITPDGTLTYTPSPRGSGTATVTIVARDTGGTANAGVDTSEPQTFTIAITSTDEEAGSYHGLVQSAPGEPRENARTGYLKLKVTPKSAFTGTLKLAGQSFPLKGYFTNDGVAHFGRDGAPVLTVMPKKAAALQLNLDLEVARNTGLLTGELTRAGLPFARIEADRSLYTASARAKAPLRTPPATLPGDYTVVFPALDPADQGRTLEEYPQGDGFGRISVSAAGVAKLTATLADGTKVSASAPIAPSGRWPLYFSAKAATLAGFANFRDVPEATDLDAAGLHWFKQPSPRAAAYPGGWTDGVLVDLLGNKYHAPRRNSGDRILSGAGSAALSFLDGGDQRVQAIEIRDDHRVTLLSPLLPGIKVTLNSRTGLFQGTVNFSHASRPSKFNGAVLQKAKIGSGFMIDGSRSEAVELTPSR